MESGVTIINLVDVDKSLSSREYKDEEQLLPEKEHIGLVDG